MEEYLVPGQWGTAEYVEKRSRFIAQVWRVSSASEAADHISAVKEKYWDATHNVYAWILRSGESHCTDDSEPRGTAGMPTLEVFRKRGVFDACCVVTRYFGGTLLGAGGLVRAYGKAASMALEAAGIYVMKKWCRARIPCPYAWYESIKQRIVNYGGTVEDTLFAENVTVYALVPAESSDALARSVEELTAGRVTVDVTGEEVLPGRLE